MDHVCKLKHYKLVLLDRSDEEPQEEQDPVGEDEEQRFELRIPRIPFHNFKGLTSNKFFKVVRNLGGAEVVILVDTGATNNFLSRSLAHQLGLQIEETPVYTVEVSMGQRTEQWHVQKGRGLKCREFTFSNLSSYSNWEVWMLCLGCSGYRD